MENQNANLIHQGTQGCGIGTRIGKADGTGREFGTTGAGQAGCRIGKTHPMRVVASTE